MDIPNNIKEEEVDALVETYNEKGVIKGTLFKVGRRFEKMVARWYVLSPLDNLMYYYKNRHDKGKCGLFCISINIMRGYSGMCLEYCIRTIRSLLDVFYLVSYTDNCEILLYFDN